jgi:anaerobic magnesium-protoporphyrin IX monomethyl ester cyclase
MAKQNVLLVYPDFIEAKGATHLKGSYSEGLASISAVLKEGGHQVSLYHMNAPTGRHEFMQVLSASKADIVAFTAWTFVFPYIKDFSIWSKQALPQAIILCGGYHATLAPEEVIACEGIDAVCIGEGELPMLDLCDRLDLGEHYLDSPSFWFKNDGQIIRNPIRPYPENLDELPLPDFELFDFENFLSSRIQTALVMLSRGCIFNCTYCANPQLREIYPNRSNYARFRSPRKSIDYLQAILNRYPFIRYFNFMDSILPLKRKWFFEFAELYSKEINLPYNCRLRSDLLDEEIVALLKKSGCYLAHLGIESGDEEIRSRYLGRKISDDQIRNSFRLLQKYDIPTLTYNIVGLPYETPAQALKTIRLNAEVGVKRSVTSIFFPYPKTRLAQIAYEAGFIGDEIDYKAQVALVQPQFSKYEVLFAHRFFRMFMAFYRLAFKLPERYRGIAEKMIASIYSSRLLPRRTLVALHFMWAGLLSSTKRVVMRFAPGIYLWLRNLLIHLRGSDRTEIRTDKASD